MSTHKICKRCEKLLPLEDFYINRKAKDGRHTKCQSCSIILAANRRLALKMKKAANARTTT